MSQRFEQAADGQAESAHSDSTRSILFNEAHLAFKIAKAAVHFLKDEKKQSAEQLLDDHIGDLVKLASMLPPGKIDVAGAFASAQKYHLPVGMILQTLRLPGDDKTVKMLSNVQSIEKSPQGTVTITQKSDDVVPIGTEIGPLHILKIDDVRFSKKISFKLTPGSEELSQVSGISVEGHGGVPSRALVSDVQDIKVLKDGSGQTVIRTRASNPENSLEKYLTKDGNDIPVDIRLKPNGKVEVSKGSSGN